MISIAVTGLVAITIVAGALTGVVLAQRATIQRMTDRMRQRTRNDLCALADVLLIESAGHGDGLTPDEAAAWDDITRRL